MALDNVKLFSMLDSTVDYTTKPIQSAYIKAAFG